MGSSARKRPGAVRVPEPVAMALAASAALAAASAALLVSGARSAAAFLDPGALGPSAPLIRADFGPSAVPAGRTGYDGQQFYAIARYFPHLHRAAHFLDLPRYRLLRIGAPALASIGGRGVGIVVALLALNILGIALAIGSVADLAVRHRRPAWIGWLAGIPLLVGLTISTPEPLAVGLALVAVDAADRGKHGRAVVLLIMSALVRESGAVVAVALAAGLLLSRSRPRWRTLAAYLLPGLAVVGWSQVLVLTIGGPLPVVDRFVPLGLLHASTPSVVVAVIALVLAGLGAWQWRDVPAAWPVAAAFGCWILVYSADTSDWLALPRAAAPAIVLGVSAAGVVAARLAGHPRRTTAALSPRLG